MQLRDNSKLLFQVAIISIALLVGAGSSFVAYQFSTLQHNVKLVVETQNKKSNYAFTMRDAIRLRAISLRNMLLYEDIFDRNDEFEHFGFYAGLYADSRENLFSMNSSEKEQEIHKKLDILIAEAKPLNQKAAEYLLSDNIDIIEGRNVVNDAFKPQEKVLNHLDKLVEVQNRRAEQLVQFVEDKYNASMKAMAIVDALLFILIISILLGISRLIRKNTRALKEATEAKSMFLANMSHEIRTPLTAILGFSTLIQNKIISSDKFPPLIDKISSNANHLLSVINDVLDISKIEANQLEIENTQFSLFKLMEDIKSIVELPIAEKSLEFRIIYQFPVPNLITTDMVRLKQIIINLCNNATKFTESGFVHVIVNYKDNDNTLHFKVKDSGIGMSREQSQLVFNAFKQADSSTTRRFGGTGLGLSISNQLTKMLGGKLEVNSELGKGSTFRFYINPGTIEENNLLDSEPDDLQNFSNKDTSSFNTKVYGNVLVAEDMEDNQLLITELLNEMGAKVTIAENGEEAVALAKETKYDLILMDMQMPIMSGTDAVIALRDANYQHPIVMLTANISKQHREYCETIGINGFLTKPLNFNALRQVVNEYLKHQDTSEPSDSNDISVVSDFVQNNNPVEPVLSSLMGKSEKYNSLITRFAEKLPEFVDGIINAIQQVDYEEALKRLHSLKGIGGNYGFLKITEICQDLEQAVSEKNQQRIEEKLSELYTLIPRINQGIVDFQHQQNKSA